MKLGPLVHEKQYEADRLNIYDVCGFRYREKEGAESCEGFSTRTHSCSISVTEDVVCFPEPE